MRLLSKKQVAHLKRICTPPRNRWIVKHSTKGAGNAKKKWFTLTNSALVYRCCRMFVLVWRGPRLVAWK